MTTEQQFSYSRTPNQSAKGRIHLETHPFLKVLEVEETLAFRGLLIQDSPEKLYKNILHCGQLCTKSFKEGSTSEEGQKRQEIQFCRPKLQHVILRQRGYPRHKSQIRSIPCPASIQRTNFSLRIKVQRISSAAKTTSRVATSK